MTTETWKPVPGYVGLYEASDWGQIRSLDREVPRGSQTLRLKGKFLKYLQNTNGSFSVVLHRDGKRDHRRVAQVIATTFLGPTPPGKEVQHRTRDHLENGVNNLMFGTPRERIHRIFKKEKHHGSN